MKKGKDWFTPARIASLAERKKKREKQPKSSIYKNIDTPVSIQEPEVAPGTSLTGEYDLQASPFKETLPAPKEWVIGEIKTERELQFVRLALANETWGELPETAYLRLKLPEALGNMLEYLEAKRKAGLFILTIHGEGKLVGFAILCLRQLHHQISDETATVLVCWYVTEPDAEERLLKACAAVHSEVKAQNPQEKSLVFASKDAKAIAKFKEVLNGNMISGTAEARL